MSGSGKSTDRRCRIHLEGAPPLHPGHTWGTLLRKAYLSFHRRANAAVLPSGLTADQFVVLTTLVEHEGLTQVEIVQRTASDPNTITAIVRLLERKGLVRRERPAHDRRAWAVYVTPGGRRVQRRAERRLSGILTELDEIAGGDTGDTLSGTLQRIHLAFVDAAAWEARV